MPRQSNDLSMGIVNRNISHINLSSSKVLLKILRNELNYSVHPCRFHLESYFVDHIFLKAVNSDLV